MESLRVWIRIVLVTIVPVDPIGDSSRDSNDARKDTAYAICAHSSPAIGLFVAFLLEDDFLLEDEKRRHPERA